MLSGTPGPWGPKLSQGGRTIEAPGRPRAPHVPGHTPGVSALYLERGRILLTGDSLVTSNPLTGRKGPQVMPRALKRDTGRALSSLARLEEVPAETILPGHRDPWAEGVSKAIRLAKPGRPIVVAR